MTPVTPIAAMTPPAMAKSGRLGAPGGEDIVELTVSDTGIECCRDPLDAVMFTT